MEPPHILLVDDEQMLLATLWPGLAQRGYDVEMVATGRAALRAAADREPDVTLLDLGLPDMDGVEVCRHLRTWSAHPIVVLTADHDDQRKVAALDEGADDYITKPFSMSELLARVRVALRHRQYLHAQRQDAPVQVGNLVIDVEGHLATLAGHPLDLSVKDFALLTALARQPGRLHPHTSLLRQVWGEEEDDVQLLRSHMTRLRKQLGTADGTPRIEAERHLGYRLVVEASEGAGGRPAEDRTTTKGSGTP